MPIGDNVSDWGHALQGRGADRFERAEEFYRGLAAGLYRDPRDRLYQAGIVAQLGIGAYLLELGASDDWCRQRIGLFIDKGLAIANQAGLNHRQPDMVHLAQLLSPYGKWRGPFAADLPTIGAIDPLRVSATLDDLLEAVRRRLADGRIEEDAR
ncbi:MULTISPECIES: hypothetical protein [unclassified Sphingopyxis]|uniref:hypothetical protein n=1 Tax=unclassified Sphingopyxis TaxID=2614943 RepID=UPI0012E3F5E8|nr:MULTISPECIES: hypothetical protein [unclassified Sphingopyxis]